MNFLEWDNVYSVGMDEIDNQHKQILNMINRLFGIKDSQDRSQQIAGILNELRDYTKTHLMFEENILSECNYPELAYHKDTHLDFIEKINSLCSRWSSGEIISSDELVNFLYDWLTSHILNCDKKYIRYVKGKQFSVNH